MSNNTNKTTKIAFVLLGAVILSCTLYFTSSLTNAETVAEIQAKIDTRNADIAALEKEIAGYQTQINDIGDQVSSLASTIKSLDLTQKKLQANILLTETKIANKNLEIQELGKQINGKEETIADDSRIISYSLALVQQSDDKSVPEIILSSNSISSAWDSLYQLGTIQGNLVKRIVELRQIKANLETNKKATEQAKAELVTLNNQLKDQRQVVLNNQSEKNQLLKETKQSETQYKQILATKQAQKDAFEREVSNYESQLKLFIDLSKIPHTGSGVLSWPLDNTFPDSCPKILGKQFKSCITQFFGNTDFATANASIYNGKGHPGIDLRASRGSSVKAALSGKIVAVTNMDAIPGCYSYGKWIMIKHSNGLSTLYGHLSLQSVQVGDDVSTGQVIGYSGNTGASTGPHLHFGVYATQGVQIMKMTSKQTSHCVGATFPFADQKAYLNPLSYL